jgi:hypothetical protein
MKVRGLCFLRTRHLIYIREAHDARSTQSEPRGLDNGSDLERRLMRPRTRVNWLICTASSDNLRIKSGSSIRSACHFHCMRLGFIFCPPSECTNTHPSHHPFCIGKICNAHTLSHLRLQRLLLSFFLIKKSHCSQETSFFRRDLFTNSMGN